MYACKTARSTVHAQYATAPRCLEPPRRHRTTRPYQICRRLQHAYSTGDCRCDLDDPTTPETYDAGYRDIVSRAQAAGVKRIILVEPFLLPVTDDQWDWREDLAPKIQAVRRIALDLGTDYVATDGPLTQRAAAVGPAALAYDGVHPTPDGHRFLADLWLDAYRSG